MTFLKINSQGLFSYQATLFESLRFLRGLHELPNENAVGLAGAEQKTCANRKLLKVAVVGRPNAGKSTLINGILKLNLCGASHKTHTTRTPFKVALTQGDTQLVFVDTPGLVSQKEYNRFNLTDDFIKWKERILCEADVIGVLHAATEPADIYRLPLNLTQNINDFPESKPKFLIFNKIDLVLDKDGLTAAVDDILGPENVDRPSSRKKLKVLNKFQKIFFISALKGNGVNEVLDYLLEQAKPGEWLFEPGQSFDRPLHVLVTDHIRSQLLDILPNEIPYECKYEVEYLKENEVGEIICVGLVTCRCNRHHHLITSGKKGSLRSICKKIESDLYKILGTVFKIRLVVQVSKN